MDFIDRLREKPSGTKKKIAFITSAVITLAIFGLWVSVYHFGINPNSSDVTASVSNSADTDVNPLSAFWSVLSKGWDGLTNNINQVKTGVGQAQDFMNTIGEATTSIPVSSSQKEVLILSGTSTDDTQITQ